MTGIGDKDIKRVFINIFHMLKQVEQNLTMLAVLRHSGTIRTVNDLKGGRMDLGSWFQGLRATVTLPFVFGSAERPQGRNTWQSKAAHLPPARKER